MAIYLDDPDLRVLSQIVAELGSELPMPLNWRKMYAALRYGEAVA